MKRFLTLFLLISMFLYASNSDKNGSKNSKNVVNDAVKKAMEQEKKFEVEQTFYKADQYDFKGSEINPESLKHIETIEPDFDFDMNEGVYDD